MLPHTPHAAPILYLITDGATTQATTPASEAFARLVILVRAATRARVDLIQLREKRLRPRVLYELTARCADLTRHTTTRLLVNDRPDIARAACADGVHLTTTSLPPHVVRACFGEKFLIGVSTHSLSQAHAAREAAADFATFGPVFDTPSKRAYGAPVGLAALHEIARALPSFPIIALGGITHENARQTLRAGAHGIAAIRLFNEAHNLKHTVNSLRGGQGEPQGL